jgi:nucleoside-diphosphate-sugar epimerase
MRWVRGHWMWKVARWASVAVFADPPEPPPEPLIEHADIGKTRRVPGYDLRVQMEQGWSRFIAWMRKEEIIGSALRG